MKNTYTNETKLGTFTSDFKKNANGYYELKLNGNRVAYFFKANNASAYQAELDFRDMI